MSRFERIDKITGNQPVRSYSGLFTAALRPVLHPSKAAGVLVERAHVAGLAIGRVSSTGHDIRVIEDRNLSVLIPTSGSIRTEFHGRESLAGPGDILVASRGRRVTRVEGTGESAFQAIVLMIDQNELTANLQPLVGPTTTRELGSDFCLVFPGKERLETRHLITLSRMLVEDLDANGDMIARIEAQHSWQELLSQKLLDILKTEHVLTSGRLISNGRNETHVKLALECIAANYAEIATIADLAAVCEVSVRTLEIAFRSVLGKSPLQVLTERRLDEARLRLLSANDISSVTEVAYDCGFGHTGRFASAYKKRFGEKPSQTLLKQ